MKYKKLGKPPQHAPILDGMILEDAIEECLESDLYWRCNGRDLDSVDTTTLATIDLSDALKRDDWSMCCLPFRIAVEKGVDIVHYDNAVDDELRRDDVVKGCYKLFEMDWRMWGDNKKTRPVAFYYLEEVS